MSNGESGSEDRPVITAAAMEKWQGENRAAQKRKKMKRKGPPRIDERVELDQADKETRQRKKAHPAKNSYGTNAPVGTSTVGASSRGPIPEKEIN